MLQQYHVTHNPVSFIPAPYINHLTVAQALSGKTLKSVRAQQIKENTGHFYLPVPKQTHYTPQQMALAMKTGIPLQTTAHTVVPSYPVITHPIKNLEHDVSISLVIITFIVAFLAVRHDRRLDEKLHY